MKAFSTVHLPLSGGTSMDSDTEESNDRDKEVTDGVESYPSSQPVRFVVMDCFKWPNELLIRVFRIAIIPCQNATGSSLQKW